LSFYTQKLCIQYTRSSSQVALIVHRTPVGTGTKIVARCAFWNAAAAVGNSLLACVRLCLSAETFKKLESENIPHYVYLA